jgi:hypothetical protein
MRVMKSQKRERRTQGKKTPPATHQRERVDPTLTRVARTRCGRDAVSNGNKLIEGLDYRSREFRRWKFLYEQQRRRVGPEADQLCRQYATAVLRREQLDADVVNKKAVDPVALTRLSSLIMRLERTLDALAAAHSDHDERAQLQREREDMEAGLV